MLTTLFWLFIAGATLITLTKWRAGIPLAMLAGILQDPVRKLTPEAPVVFVLASVPIWAAVAFGALVREKGNWKTFKASHPRVAWLMAALGVSLLLPTALVLSFGRSGWLMAVLGVSGYISPLVGIVIGHSFGRDAAQIRRLMVFYCLVVATMLSGTLLEYVQLFPEWSALGTQALGGTWIRNTGDETVLLISGFFRSPDIMGWHAATLVMLGGTILLDRGRGNQRVWLIPIILGAVCLLLGGRRKMTMMPIIWACTIGIVLVRTGGLRRAVSLSILGGLILAGIHFASGEIEVHDSYYVYAGSASSEGLDRLFDSLFGSVWETYKQAGFFGRGIGTATQGVRHLGVGDTQTWQESGPSKVLVELGVPGFLCGVLLLTAMVRAGATGLRQLPPGPGGATLALGLLAFAAANTASFTISHQAYSDALVMDLTAFFLGVFLAAPRWAQGASVAPFAASRFRVGEAPRRMVVKA